MKDRNNKPKLVLFQFRYEKNVPEFLLIHKQEHVRCLSQFFEVTVINEDCDYREICERHEPDLVVFESGLEILNSHRLKIKNISSCPEVPKVAFLNADGCTEHRAGILSDMDIWGTKTAFSISICAAEHLSQISKNLFVWPNFIDPAVFRDYGIEKNIPLLLTGSLSPRYPWRHKVYKLIAEHYPSLVCPHGGYVTRVADSQMLIGEKYARTINASIFVPTCGSVTKEVIRKHFEVPGSRSCLVTERSPGLKSAGFTDMVNCVFADESDILDKIAYLFEHQEELRKITDNGWRLVQSKHTIKNRDQIFQWFKLNKLLKTNQRIVQPTPFARLEIVTDSSKISNNYIVSNGLHLTWLKRGDEFLWKRKYEDAERCYLKSLSFLSELPEAKFGLH